MATTEFKQKVMRALALKGYHIPQIAKLAESDPEILNKLISCIENKTTGFFKKSFDDAVDECAKKYLV